MGIPYRCVHYSYKNEYIYLLKDVKEKKIDKYISGYSKQTKQAIRCAARHFASIFFLLFNCDVVMFRYEILKILPKNKRFSIQFISFEFRFRFIQWPSPLAYHHFCVYSIDLEYLSLMNLNCCGVRITTFPFLIVAGKCWPIVWKIRCHVRVACLMSSNSFHPFQKTQRTKNKKKWTSREITQFPAANISHWNF